MKTTAISLISLLYLLNSFCVPAFAQVDPCEKPAETIPISFEVATLYPTMQPAHYLRVILSAFKETPFRPGWWRNTANYRLEIAGKPMPTPPPTFDTHELTAFFDFRTQDLRDGEVIKLKVLLPRIKGGDTCATGVSGEKTEVAVTGIPRSAVTLEPSWVPKQDLITGAKRDVGHLNINVDIKTLSFRTPIRLYVKGDQVVSTDGKDKTTKLEGVFGGARSLTRRWLVPVHGEAKVIGDQRVRNSSLVFSGGMRTILPWGWSRGVFWNGIVRAPFSPDIEISGQWERRMRQDLTSQRENPDRTAGRVFTQVSWNAIHIFTGPEYTRDDLSLQVVGKGWVLPKHRTSTNQTRNRLEGHLQVALLVPLRKFDATTGGISPSHQEAAKQRIRLEFAGGANEASGFQHFRKLSLGLEIIK